MAIKNLDWNKVTTSLPVTQIDKGEIKTVLLKDAYGNAKSVLSAGYKVTPLPASGPINIGE